MGDREDEVWQLEQDRWSSDHRKNSSGTARRTTEEIKKIDSDGMDLKK